MAKITPPNPTAAALVDIAAKIEPKIELDEHGAIKTVTLNNPGPQPGYPQPALEPELIGKVPAKKSNGPAPRENVERGLRHFDVLEAERDQLDRELREARLEIAKLKQQIEQIEDTRNLIDTRINQCVLERDHAVREAGELRGALNSVASICVRYHNAEQQD